MIAAIVCLTAGVLAPAHADDKSAGYYRHGLISMAAKNYDQAYADFKYAMQLRPNDADYEIAAEKAQYQAANAHIQRGEQYKTAKQYPEAAREFQRASEIDPANFIAAQELQAVTDLMHPPAPLPGAPVGANAASALEERLARAAGPTELGPVASTIIKDFTVNGDPRSAYLAAGKLAGLNVIFDSSSQGGYTNSGHVTLDLHNVSLLQILRILGVETDSFYTPVTPNTILVANDNAQKHTAIDPSVVKVFYVKNIQSPSDLSELAQAIRGLMQPQPVLQPVPSINALVMRGSPDKVAVVQKLLDDLDKAPPEVTVDIRILQVNRDLARDLGLLPPTSFSIGLQAPQTSTTNSTTTTSTTTTGTTPTTTNSPTLNELTHLNSTNFSVTIPNATLNALLSDSNTHTIQEPQLRSIQGQKSTLQIGQKIPIATGSFQPGIGGVGINPLVNTQFNYQPVGVIIDMTPQIHGDNSVLLKNHIEITDVDSYNNVGGIQQPVFGNRVLDHTIELKNGESAVLGGMLVDTITHNITGIPGLNTVPLFKYLFSSTHDETAHSEIMIVMTPHIVRGLNITADDRRALDTGTQDNVELHELPPATVAEPAPGTTSQPGVTTGQPGLPPVGVNAAGAAGASEITPAAGTPSPNPPSPGAAAAPSGGGGIPTLGFSPTNISAVTGNPFGVKLDIANATDAYALTFQLNYDPKLIQIQSINLAGFLSQDGQAPALVHREDAASGTAQISVSRPPNVRGISGSGDVMTITFIAKAPGVSPITITRLGARNPQGAATTLQTDAATVTVR